MLWQEDPEWLNSELPLLKKKQPLLHRDFLTPSDKTGVFCSKPCQKRHTAPGLKEV